MRNNTYKVTGKFICNGEKLVTVIMNNAACVTPECEYERIVKMEKRNKYRRWMKMDYKMLYRIYNTIIDYYKINEDVFLIL